MFDKKQSVGATLVPFVSTYATTESHNIDYTIYPDDEMYTFVARAMGEAKARMLYIKLGSELTRTIKQIAQWRFGRQLGQVKLLEFACGYGRNVRHLVHVFPRRNITVSDIMEKAVRFNMEQFQVAGRLSVHDPADLDWSERFDMIVVPSLFSHLPARTFAGWIAALYGLLAEDGILVFSVLGDNVLDDRVAMPETGIHYELHSENEVLDKEEYGLAHVTDSFVREQVIKATGRTDYGLIERGFWKHQNVYMLTRGDLVEPASFHYDRGLIGNIDQVTLQIDGMMRISGWAVETNQATNLNVTACAYLDGAKVAESPVIGHRADVAKVWGKSFNNTGFVLEFSTSLPHCRPDSNLIIEIKSQLATECLHSLGLKDSLTEDNQGSFPNSATTRRRDFRHLFRSVGGSSFSRLARLLQTGEVSGSQRR